jgi:chromosome segregation ATPase
VEADDDYWRDKKKEIKAKETNMRTETDKFYALIEQLSAQISEMQSKRANIEESKRETIDKINSYKGKDRMMKEAQGRLHTEREQL